MIVLGMRLMTYEYVVTLNSGASGQGWTVAAAPPVLCRASSTSGFAPARARYAPATRPLWPPPMTMASYAFCTCNLPLRPGGAATVPNTVFPVTKHPQGRGWPAEFDIQCR